MVAIFQNRGSAQGGRWRGGRLVFHQPIQPVTGCISRFKDHVINWEPCSKCWFWVKAPGAGPELLDSWRNSRGKAMMPVITPYSQWPSGSRTRFPGFRSQFCHVFTVWLWGNDWVASAYFLNHTMGAVPQRVAVKIKGVNTCKTPGTWAWQLKSCVSVHFGRTPSHPGCRVTWSRPPGLNGGPRWFPC